MAVDVSSYHQNLEQLQRLTTEKHEEFTRARAFNNKHTLHDPSINVVVSRSTLKYALIALLALGLLASFLYLLIVGLLNQHTCMDISPGNNLSIYLIVMGCVGCVRLLTFFSCPFDYSKSIMSKMYEHLLWRLVINRFKTAYHGAAAQLKTRLWEQGESASISRRIYFRFACFGSFLINFACCGLQCCLCCFQEQDEEVDHDHDLEYGRVRPAPNFFQPSRAQPIPEVSFTLWEEKPASSSSTDNPTAHETNLQAPNELSKSVSNLSVITETTLSSRGIILNELNCFKPPFERVTSEKAGRNSRRRDQSSRNITRTASMPTSRDRPAPRSRSANELRSSASSSSVAHSKQSSSTAGGRKVKFSQSSAEMRAKQVLSTYGNQYFSGKYDSKYGTHKHLRKHHNRTQRPIRLFDFNSVRYGVFYLLQRAMDVFIICWFICGNYWVFNADFPETSEYSPLSALPRMLNESMLVTTTPASTSKSYQSRYIKFSLSLFGFTDSSQQAKTSLMCYQTAFVHIVSVYALIALIVFLAISFQFYQLIGPGKRTPPKEIRTSPAHQSRK